MRRRVSLSLLLGAAALFGCGPDEVSSPTTRSPEPAAAKGGGLPILTTAKVGESGSFTVPEAAQNYNITLRFVNPVTPKQAADFQTAAARWQGLIHGDVADVQGSFPKNACGNSFKMPAFSGVIDDLLINVLLQPIDGPGNVLGAAGACFFRTDDGIPVFGLMFFDVDDLAFLEQNNLLDEVIVHEMGHVLGFSGFFFNLAGLLLNPNTVDPRFLGNLAIGKYHMLGGTLETVPIEGVGGRCGAGTANSHWDEGTFFNELMTGFINGASSNFINPMSPMTSGALHDLGYVATPQGESYELRTSPNDPCPPPAPLTNAVAKDGLAIAAHEIVISPVGRLTK
jgi:Leishmanolysin